MCYPPLRCFAPAPGHDPGHAYRRKALEWHPDRTQRTPGQNKYLRCPIVMFSPRKNPFLHFAFCICFAFCMPILSARPLPQYPPRILELDAGGGGVVATVTAPPFLLFPTPNLISAGRRICWVGVAEFKPGSRPRSRPGRVVEDKAIQAPRYL